MQFCISDLPVLQVQMSCYRLIILWMLRSTDIESVCPCVKLFQIEVNNIKKIFVFNTQFYING
jgi:hypothetical protein